MTQPPSRDLAAARRPVVVYDADCAFCRVSLRVLTAWDRNAALQPLALQTPAADRILAPVAPDARGRSWHLVLTDGRIYSAGDAAAPLLALLPGGRPLAALASTFPRTTRFAYALVARNRARLSRVVRALGAG